MGAGVNGESIILLKVVYLADSRPKNGFLPRTFVGPFAFACWKSLQLKQSHLSYCPGLYTYSLKFSRIYLLYSNLDEFFEERSIFRGR